MLCVVSVCGVYMCELFVVVMMVIGWYIFNWPISNVVWSMGLCLRSMCGCVHRRTLYMCVFMCGFHLCALRLSSISSSLLSFFFFFSRLSGFIEFCIHLVFMQMSSSFKVERMRLCDVLVKLWCICCIWYPTDTQWYLIYNEINDFYVCFYLARGHFSAFKLYYI